MPKPLFSDTDDVIEGFQDNIPAYFTNKDSRTGSDGAKNAYTCQDVLLTKNVLCGDIPGGYYGDNKSKVCTLDEHYYNQDIPLCSQAYPGLPKGVCPGERPYLYSQSGLSWKREQSETPYGKICTPGIEKTDSELTSPQALTPTNYDSLQDSHPGDTYHNAKWAGSDHCLSSNMMNNPQAGGIKDLIQTQDTCVDMYQLKPMGLPALDFRIIQVDYTEVGLSNFFNMVWQRNLNSEINSFYQEIKESGGNIHYYVQFISEFGGGSKDIGDWNNRIFWIKDPERVKTFNGHTIDFTRIWATRDNSHKILATANTPYTSDDDTEKNQAEAIANLENQLDDIEFFKYFRGETFDMSLFEHSGSGPGFLLKDGSYIPEKCEERSQADCLKAVGCIKNAATCQTDHSLTSYSKFDTPTSNRPIDILTHQDIDNHPELTEKGAYAGSSYYTVSSGNDSSKLKEDTPASCLALGGILSGNKCIDPRLECIQTGTKYMPVTDPPLTKTQMHQLDHFFPYDTKCPLSHDSFGTLSGPQENSLKYWRQQRLGLIQGGDVRAGPSSDSKHPEKNPTEEGSYLASMYIVFSENYENPQSRSRGFDYKNGNGSDSNFRVMTGPFIDAEVQVSAQVGLDIADNLKQAYKDYKAYLDKSVKFKQMQHMSASSPSASSGGYNWIVPVHDYIWCCDASVVDGGSADNNFMTQEGQVIRLPNEPAPKTDKGKYRKRVTSVPLTSNQIQYQWKCFRKTPANKPGRPVNFTSSQKTEQSLLEGSPPTSTTYVSPDPYVRQIHRIVPDPHGPNGPGIILIVDYDKNPLVNGKPMPVIINGLPNENFRSDKYFSRVLMRGMPDGSLLEPFDNAGGDNPFSKQGGYYDSAIGYCGNFLDVYAGHPDHIFFYRSQSLVSKGRTANNAGNDYGLYISGVSPPKSDSSDISGVPAPKKSANYRYIFPSASISKKTSGDPIGPNGPIGPTQDNSTSPSNSPLSKPKSANWSAIGAVLGTFAAFMILASAAFFASALFLEVGTAKFFEALTEEFGGPILAWKAVIDFALSDEELNTAGVFYGVGGAMSILAILVPLVLLSGFEGVKAIEKFTGKKETILSEQEKKAITQKIQEKGQNLNEYLTNISNNLFNPTAKIFSGDGGNYVYMRHLNSVSTSEPTHTMETTDIKNGKKSLSYSNCTGTPIYRYDVKKLVEASKTSQDTTAEELFENGTVTPCYSPSQVWWGGQPFARDSLSSGSEASSFRKTTPDYRSAPLFENFDASDPDYIWATGLSFPQYNDFTDKEGKSHSSLIPFGATMEFDGGWMKPVFNLFRCKKHKEADKINIFEWEVYEPAAISGDCHRVMNFAYDPQGQPPKGDFMSLTEYTMRESLFYRLEKTPLEQKDVTKLAKDSLTGILDADKDTELSVATISPQLSLDPNDPNLLPSGCGVMPDIALILYPRMDRIQSPYDVCYYQNMKEEVFSLWLKIDGKRMWIADGDWYIDTTLYASSTTWTEASSCRNGACGGWNNKFSLTITNEQACKWISGKADQITISYQYQGSGNGWNSTYSDYANMLFIVKYSIPMIIPDNATTENEKDYTLTAYTTSSPISSFGNNIQTITKDCFFGLTPVSGQGKVQCTQWEYAKTMIQNGKLVKQVLRPIYSINGKLDVRPGEWNNMVQKVSQKAVELKRKDILDSLSFENNTKILISTYRDINDHDSIMNSIMTHLDLNQKELNSIDSKIQNYQRQQEISDNASRRHDERLFMLKVLLVYLLVIAIPFILKYMFPGKGISKYFTLIIAVITIPFWVGVSIYLYNIRNRSNQRWQLRNYEPGKEIKKLEEQQDQQNGEECDTIDNGDQDDGDDSQFQSDMERLVDRARHEKYCIKHHQAKHDPQTKNRIKSLEKKVKTLESHKRVDQKKAHSIQLEIDHAEKTIKKLKDARHVK